MNALHKSREKTFRLEKILCRGTGGGDGILHGIGNLLDIAGVDAGHGEAAVHGAVDVVLVGEDAHVLLLETGEGKHTCREEKLNASVKRSSFLREQGSKRQKKMESFLKVQSRR